MQNDANTLTVGQSEFVDLDRTLREISAGEKLTDEPDLQARMGSGVSMTWAELCHEMRVVVLAEAGSGKTSEIRNLASRLRHDGKTAFFIRLELLAEKFELAFEQDLFPSFQGWLASQEEAWLLLDSVDEARLRHPGDFGVGIRRLASVLGAAKSRAHIVLTSRISAWRPATDLGLCVELLPHPSPDTNARISESDDVLDDDNIKTERFKGGLMAGYRVVALENLSDDQVNRFAAARGVLDSAAFVDAVERADAKGFTGRPQDLEELVDFWLVKGLIGSRWDILTGSIDRRLEERDQNRAVISPLSPEKARLGAKILAAAVTLTGVPVIRVPDGSDTTLGIAVSTILPQWTDAEVEALLQRPLFDGAIYGTIRFHHRSVREFLAAQWFADKLQLAQSRLGIELLFFRRQYGIEVLSPMLRPVLPWLMIMDEKIRRRVLALAPELVFEGGDPSCLPLADRKRILTDVCEQLSKHASARSVQDYSAVQRFAKDDMADEIRRLLQRYLDDREVAPFLLRMVWLGRLHDLSPEVIELSTNPSHVGYRRLTAVRALNAIGTESEIDKARQAVLAEPGDIDRRLLSEWISRLPGTPASVTWLLAAVRRAAPKKKYGVDYLAHELATYVERIPVIDQALVDGLEALLSTAPMQNDLNNQVSQQFEWVLVAAARGLARLIREQNQVVLTPSGHSLIRRVSTARSYQSNVLSGERVSFGELLPTWTELNRTQFWYDVEQMRVKQAAKGGPRVIDWWRPASYGAAWRFGAADFDYSVETIASRPLLDDQLVALTLAFHLYQNNGRPRHWLAAMERAATDGELADQLNTLLHPIITPEMRKLKAQERRWMRRDQQRNEAEAREFGEARDKLNAQLEQLRTELRSHPERAGRLNAIRYLFDRIHEEQNRNHWSSYDWHSLAKDFGNDLAELFRDAARNSWRFNRLKLRSEGAPANETTFATILGIAGLDIETRESPAVLKNMSPDEIEIASRHAVSELNGFPSWFPTLFEHQRAPVAAFLFAQIRHELSGAVGENRGNDILSDVSWSGQWVWDDLAPMLIELLHVLEPIDSGALSKALKIVRGANGPDTAIANLARLKCKSVTEASHLGQWFAVWMGTDPDLAIPAFGTQLAALPAEQATELSMLTAVALFGGNVHSEPVARPAFLKPRALRRLHAIFHQYIRRGDDIHRAGSGVYSPGLRDDAQDARDSILGRLRDEPGKDALLALREIAGSQPGQEWLSRLLREKAEREGDFEPLEPQDVRYLGDHFECRPRSARQLGDTTRLRLLQLKEAVEENRSLDARVLEIADAITARDLLRTRLEAQSDNAYTVAVPNDASLSLVISGVGYAATQPLIAIASEDSPTASWVDTLASANTSRRGAIAVFQLARSKQWRWPWSKSPVLDEAVTKAQAHWEAKEDQVPTLDDVEVIGIDLTRIPPALGKKDNWDRIFDFLRWFFGTTLLGVGRRIIIVALATLTGILPAVVELALVKLLDIQLEIHETAAWVGWVLLIIGLIVVLLGTADPHKRR